MRERNINWSDLIIKILLKWRSVLIVMVLGGVLFAGISYVKSYRNIQQIKEVQENEVDEEVYSEDEKANVDIVLEYERVYETKERYQSYSVLMQMDPTSIQKAELIFLIKSDDREKSYNIEKIYEDLIVGGDLFNWLKEKHGIESNVVSELIELERRINGQSDGSDSLCISVKHYDKEICKELTDSILEYVNMQCESMQEVLGEHEVIVVAQSLTVVSDSKLLETQRTYANDIITLKTKIAELKGKFSDKEYQYYNSVSDRDEEDVEAADKVPEVIHRTPQISFKYIVIGMAAAICLYLFVLFWIYIFNSKLRDGDNMEELYDVFHLGSVPGTDIEKRKALGFIDDAILKLHNRNRHKYTQEEAIVLAANAIKAKMHENDLNTVNILVGNADMQLQDVCGKIAAVLSKEKIDTDILECSVFDQAILECLQEKKNVVLIERAGDAFYNDVAQQIEILKQQQIKIIGGIIVGH